MGRMAGMTPPALCCAALGWSLVAVGAHWGGAARCRAASTSPQLPNAVV